VLLPEKTVEIWTGIAIARFLPFAQVWSPPNRRGSIDQWIRAGKTWAFELKTAYEGSPTHIPIDLEQLWTHAGNPPHGVPVLYVLPKVPWLIRPIEPVRPEAASLHGFPWWAWVTPAKQLARRLWPSTTRPSVRSLQTVNIEDLPFPYAHPRWKTGMSLAEFLTKVGACREPEGWTTRTADDRRSSSRRDNRNENTEEVSNYVIVHVPKANLPSPVPPTQT
jgi:hypothetical protein